MPIGEIVVRDRYRSDLGDVSGLAESIAEFGLLNPITVTASKRLVAGQRRLEACRKLGMVEVPVRVVDGLDDAVAHLSAERDENTQREPMKASELAALGKALEALERPKAAERQRSGLREGDASPLGSNEHNGEGRTREKVAAALGMSDTSYQRLAAVAKEAEAGNPVAVEALADVDAGEASISGAAKRVREAKKAAPVRKPEAERATEIRTLAESGHVAAQIAQKLGVGEEHVRNIAGRNGIELPDARMGRRRRIDSDRVAEETVVALESHAFAVRLIDFEELTVDHFDDWAASLKQSLRNLNRFYKQLKEMAQ